MRNKIILILFLFAIVFASCQEEPISNNIIPEAVDGYNAAIIDSTLGFTVKVQDSTLYFLDAEDLLVALSTLKEMPVDKRRNWEKSIGFVSAQSMIEDLQKEIEMIENEDEFHELIKANSEFIKESPDDLYGIKSRIYGFYPYITSTRGFFVSESSWGKVFDGKLYSCSYYDYEAYNIMCTLSSNIDVASTNVKFIQLDFNEDDHLKSYHVVENQTPTRITIAMKNYSDNNPTKVARFNMEIINSYAMSTESTPGGYKYFYLITYFGDCCVPFEYTYYYAALGGTQYFERHENQWRIPVPYPGYLDDYNWSAGDPNWDESLDDYMRETTPAYYNYIGNAKLECNIQAQKRNVWQNWVAYDGSVINYSNVSAQIQVGLDVAGHSSLHSENVSVSSPNSSNREGDYHETSNYVSTYLLHEYSDTPPVVFKGCVSGSVYARLCPASTCNFSYTY